MCFAGPDMLVISLFISLFISQVIAFVLLSGYMPFSGSEAVKTSDFSRNSIGFALVSHWFPIGFPLIFPLVFPRCRPGTFPLGLLCSSC